jgi:hypothetical protein
LKRGGISALAAGDRVRQQVTASNTFKKMADSTRQVGSELQQRFADSGRLQEWKPGDSAATRHESILDVDSTSNTSATNE